MHKAKLPLGALLLLVLLCMSCGGGGTTPAPPGTVPPTITGVSPLVVTAGSEVKFTATTTGSTITRWRWTFGNAASPTTSSQQSPTVDINTPGVYECQVRGENAWFETTTTFNLTVE